jgi:hypothetical protein
VPGSRPSFGFAALDVMMSPAIFNSIFDFKTEFFEFVIAFFQIFFKIEKPLQDNFFVVLNLSEYTFSNWSANSRLTT